MLPPFLCRSHRIVRRSTWGNICCILSTAASRVRSTDAALCRDADADGGGDGEKKRNRITNAVISSITIRYGSEICSFAMIARRGRIRCTGRSASIEGSEMVRAMIPR